MEQDKWKLLQAPFPRDQVEMLAKYTGKKEQLEQSKRECKVCGGWHGHPAVHLDYIGHAGITMRLNEVDPSWSWEPMSLDADGLPKFSQHGLWIRLTILGKTMIGFGDAQGKDGPNAIKEIIGDAIRNAAMRFGVGTYLWSKSEAAQKLREGEEPDNDPAPAPKQDPKNPIRPGPDKFAFLDDEPNGLLSALSRATTQEHIEMLRKWWNAKGVEDAYHDYGIAMIQNTELKINGGA